MAYDIGDVVRDPTGELPPVRYAPRAWMCYDTHEVELPNHGTAIENLDLTNPRLRIRRWWPVPRETLG